jgi:predicted ATPase/class 3 adenylate cyclase
VPETGTLTLLFTDLVGSTESLVALGEDRYDSVRDEHDALVGGTITAHDGEIVKHTGDGYMAVFLRATDALGAAAEIQRLVSRRNEASEVPLEVRIGISAGDVTKRAGDYQGVAAVEAARLCAAGAGGQILVSETVRSLVGSRGGHDFVALGEVDLKGLPPLATVAVRWCDDAPVFAPPRPVKGNLPASVDRFIGRQHDLDAIRALLGEHRLVTLTGPGGSGKTRLALEVARSIGTEYADGVWLVDLALIDDETVIAEATMGALGLRGSDAPARDVLVSCLAGRDTVLVVDNCEHVVGGAARLIADLLARCPRMRVVATSRESLRVPGEAEFVVEGLGRKEAVELFAARVPGGRPIGDPGAIDRICAALEGIPLGLELAAAKLRVLSPAQLADRLDDQLAVLVRGRRTAPERQRTLRATLDWSYDLLDEDERVVFRRLGIFAGGCTPEAAEHVVADDRIPRDRVINLLEELVERSLLTVVPGGWGARFRLLEPIRQYAAKRLGEAGEQNALADRHLEWVRHFTRQTFLGGFAAHHESIVRIRDEHPNVCQALEFAIGNRDGVNAAKIIDALGLRWFAVGQPDARVWCERVLAVVSTETPALPRAGALVASAMMLYDAQKHDAAVSLLLEAREVYRSANSVRGEANALYWLGRVAAFRASGSEASALYEEALWRFRESDTPVGVGHCLAFLAMVAAYSGDDDLARRRADEAVQLGESAQIDPQIVGEALRVLAIVDARAGDFENSDRQLAEAIAIHQAADSRGPLISAHATAAEVAASRGDVARASSHLAAGAEIARGMPSSTRALTLVPSAAYVAYMDDRSEDAAMLFGARLGLSRSTFPPRFRPVLEALQKQGLGSEIAAGANLSADEALDRVAELANARISAPS